MLEDFLKRDFPGRLLFARVWGSMAHNTNKPDSDTDFIAVYAAPTDEILGLFGAKDNVVNKEGEKPDFQAQEVGKFCRLLLKGNPGILECLFSKKFVYETREWLELKAQRKRFLTVQAVGQYVGYAKGQLQKLRAGTSLHTKGGKFCEKWGYHLIRILGDAQRIASGGEPVIWKDGPERDTLMKIRLGEIPQDQIEEMAGTLLADINSRLEHPAIPSDGDAEFLNRWLLGIRKSGGVL